MLASSLTIDRRSVVVAGELAPLATSLAADLDRLLPDEDVFVPTEKAKMTRRGGRCLRDGAFLEFDPKSPRRHRCPVCGTVHEGEDHYRWWIMEYQLWLAERTVHAAALWRVCGAARHQTLAEAILSKFAERYLTYPNEDNVLGPTRVFFSTYLESIWMLQLAVAVSLLERETSSAVGGLVRDRVLSPSSELVGSFNEGLSNRQVWNSAALAAVGVLLERPGLIDRAMFGVGGLEQLLRSGLLEDGTWYEGENYHLFAHRGLWYLVMLAEHLGATLPPDSTARFEGGFAAPLRTALPDFTFPARRDSQYRASLRQWRVAESVELGLARTPDSPELAGGLGELYGDAPVGDSARWRSTAEAERNVPGVRLTRADLSWKSLLFASPRLPAKAPAPSGSALMAGQGFAVIRRDKGRVYVALDYGHSGGSHGHPDRLNLWLVVGDRRLFEDVGTGSYVERTLHWYRSTLAHNAPLVDGRSQDFAAGMLLAWDERDGCGWIDAQAPITDGVLVRRTLVVTNGHFVDRLEWHANRIVTLDLPMHIEAEIEGAWWKPGALRGGAGLEDGFDFVSDAETADVLETPCHLSAHGIDGSVHIDVAHAWWRAVAPGPPGEGPRRFFMVRARGERGCITSAWSWTGPVQLRVSPDGKLDVSVARVRYGHRQAGDTWRLQERDTAEVILAGRREAHGSLEIPLVTRAPVSAEATPVATVPLRDVSIGDLTARGNVLRYELGEENYRRTEATWDQAGSPTATVVIGATLSELLVEVSVESQDPNFAAARGENPLDNEHPDINSDGVQVHLSCPGHAGRPLAASWLLVPEPGSAAVRINGRGDAYDISLRASWRRTATGWQLLARIDRGGFGPAESHIGLDVIVNEMPRWRERRRGQLVLSGGAAGWAYLRGDRQDAGRLIPLVVRSV
jgi:hypothetical protein